MRRTVSELTCWVRSFYASFFPWRTSLTERWSRPSWELGIRGLSSLLLCSSGYCVYCIQCTMCTFWNTILLYPKMPCICFRGIIKFHCIFAGSWRFMPQIFYMIQGNNWGKITNVSPFMITLQRENVSPKWSVNFEVKLLQERHVSLYIVVF